MRQKGVCFRLSSSLPDLSRRVQNPKQVTASALEELTTEISMESEYRWSNSNELETEHHGALVLELSASQGFGVGCWAGRGSQRAGGLGDLNRWCRVRPQPHSYCDQVSYHVTEISPQRKEEWELSHPGPPSLGIWPSSMETDEEKTRSCVQPPV